MPIREFINLSLLILTGICITHPMTAALEIRKIELSILREASDTRSWGVPVIFPEGKSTGVKPHILTHHKHATANPHANRL